MLPIESLGEKLYRPMRRERFFSWLETSPFRSVPVASRTRRRQQHFGADFARRIRRRELAAVRVGKQYRVANAEARRLLGLLDEPPRQPADLAPAE